MQSDYSLFGTDGVRGSANDVLTVETVLRMGRALVSKLDAHSYTRPTIVVGRDPRPSGDMLQSALEAGICSAGGDVLDVGVVPTGAVSFLTRKLHAGAGVMITASHNPMPDNGLKFFDAEGWKYSRNDEVELEHLTTKNDVVRRPKGLEVGRLQAAGQHVETYIDNLLDGSHTLSAFSLKVDCANGAASHVAPLTYSRAGATVSPIASDLTGNRINDGVGSTNIEYLLSRLSTGGGEVGLAHDGDADRLILVDEEGDIWTGSHTLAVLAWDRHERGIHGSGTVVTTTMSNSGLGPSLKNYGITLIETEMGDRNVVEVMRVGGHTLGGEHYGNITFLEKGATGDGLRTAVEILNVAVRRGTPLYELKKIWKPRPQSLRNVSVETRQTLRENSKEVERMVSSERDKLGCQGRLMVRMSSIEPVVRVMCEAESQDAADDIVSRVASMLRSL